MSPRCFDKRVIGGLILVGFGILALNPSLFTSALPLLLVAVCPLSMLFMGRALMGKPRNIPLAQQQEPLSLIDAQYHSGPVLNRADQVAALQGQLQRLGRQHMLLASQLAELESVGTTSSSIAMAKADLMIDATADNQGGPQSIATSNVPCGAEAHTRGSITRPGTPSSGIEALMPDVL